MAEPLFMTAARRLGVLRGMQESGKDAYTYGPFADKPPAHPRDSEPTRTTPLPQDDAAELAKHHRTMADYYAKKAGSDTVPHTTGLNDDDHDQLAPEIDMVPQDGKE